MTVRRWSDLVKLTGSRMEILPGLRHGALSLNKPEQFVEIMMNWIGE